jgi:hypothetical protein
MDDVDFTRMSYLIDCSSQVFNNDQLSYRADEWSINEDRIVNNDDDDDSIKDYIISIDLSNSLSLKTFTNQPESFLLQSNSFNSPLYKNLKLLNLSSCCQQISNEYSQIFRPLNKLQILDLSGSDMYKTCLSTPGMTSVFQELNKPLVFFRCDFFGTY